MGIYVHGSKNSTTLRKFSKNLLRAKFAITVSPCTAGMHLIYFSLGIGKGDEVILPAQTHTATVYAIELTGAKPVFVDCDKKWEYKYSRNFKKINRETKAICVVHYLGIPVNINPIKNS